MSNSELITVGRAYGLSEAASAVALLGASGTLVFPTNWYLASMAWHWTNAFGGVELRVPAAQALDASALLADFAPPLRPKSLRRRLLLAVVSLMVLSVTGFPPPASGFFPVALRAVSSRSSSPAPALPEATS